MYLQVQCKAEGRPVENLWVKVITQGENSMQDVIEGIYYKPLNQEEEVDEDFFKMVEASKS